MKNRLLILLLLLGTCSLIAQTSSIRPDHPFQPEEPSPENLVLYPQLGVSTGLRLGLGYGVFREVKQNLELIANASINWWRFNRTNDFPSIGTEFGIWYFNVSIGERFKIVDCNKSRLYTGINLNNQFYFDYYSKNYGLGIEPNISWSRDLGKRHEFNFSLGYDQHLISFDQRNNLRPGKINLSIGFNLDLQKPEVQEPIFLE